MGKNVELPDWEGFGGAGAPTAKEAFSQIEEALNGENPTQSDIARFGLALTQLLLIKNKKYGNSAAEPVAVFSRLDAFDRLKVRMDDKLSRLSRGDNDADNEDAFVDLAGYLLLTLVVRNQMANSEKS